MSLWEHVLNLFTRSDIPVRHIVGYHILLPFFPLRCRSLSLCHHALPHGLHNLEGLLRFHSLINQIGHDIIPGTHAGGNRRRAVPYQILCVSHPHIGAMGKPGDPYKIRERFRFGFDYHVHGKVCTEFRDTQTPQLRPADLLRCNPQRLRVLKKAHNVRAVQGNGQRVSARHILEHSNHGGIIVSQNIQLQQVMVN